LNEPPNLSNEAYVLSEIADHRRNANNQTLLLKTDNSFRCLHDIGADACQIGDRYMLHDLLKALPALHIEWLRGICTFELYAKLH
jgi:hypothetical protein